MIKQVNRVHAEEVPEPATAMIFSALIIPALSFNKIKALYFFEKCIDLIFFLSIRPWQTISIKYISFMAQAKFVIIFTALFEKNKEIQ